MLTLALFSSASTAPKYSWNPFGQGFATDTTLWADGVSLIEYQGDLYAAGHFDRVDVQPITGIARWDGTQWHQIGEHHWGDRYTIWTCTYDGKLAFGFDVWNDDVPLDSIPAV